MRNKRLIRWVLFSLPLLLILAQVFWKPFEYPASPRQLLEQIKQPLEIVYRYFDFNHQNALKEWKEKVIQGHVGYQIDFDQTNGFIHAKSESASSAIFRRIRYNLEDYPLLSWKWRVAKFPDKSGAENAEALDDFPGRVFVVFLSRFFTSYECVEYIWDEKLPVGTIMTSPYSDKIKQYVIQSGRKSADDWVTERRNVLDDYRKLWGHKPDKKVGAIALMTDSDGTGGQAEAFFDDIKIGKPADGQKT